MRFILALLSIKIAIDWEPPELVEPVNVGGKKGRASASAKNKIASALSAINKYCLIRIRRIVLLRSSLKNDSVENDIFCGRRKLTKWIITGTATANSPNKKKGLRKFICNKFVTFGAVALSYASSIKTIKLTAI
jgi:hypothetical protein